VNDDKKTPKSKLTLLPWVLVGTAAVLLAGALSLRTAVEQSWLDDLATEENIGGLHTTDPLAYKNKPPMGGPHHPAWHNCGTFSEPIGDTHAVHSLEHGAVWVTYEPDQTTPEDVAELAAIANRNDYVMLSPYPGQGSKIVLTAWNNQLRLDRLDAPMVRRFVAYFAKAMTAPEPGAPCDGGVDSTVKTSTPPATMDETSPADVTAEEIIGLTEADAARTAEERGLTLRIGERDGETYMLTADYVDTRITVKIENGKVTDAVVG